MNSKKRALLIKAIRERPKETNLKLAKSKQEAVKILEKKDWLWHLLLSSMATLGNSGGYKGLIENIENYNEVKYQTLLKENKQERFKNIKKNLEKSECKKI